MKSIVGYYTTCFGELWEKSLSDLTFEAINGVIKNSNLEVEQIDAIFFANMLGGVLENNVHISSKIAEMLGIHIPIFRVESACASGGVAFHLASKYMDDSTKTVLVVGAEKMNDFSPEQVTTALSSAASTEEQDAGLTFPGLYAMLANYYMEKYHYEEKHLAAVSVKNHFHGTLNEKAHFKRKITIDQVLKSPYIAHPLKVLDSSPISDGAAAVILSNDKNIISQSPKSVAVLSSEVATDSISLAHRKNLDELEATKIAAEKAFKEAKIKPIDIQVAELHDCFSIAELLAMEDIGFWKKGEAGSRMIEMPTQFGSESGLIVNTSGGLKAAGHPVGATGIKQIGEVFLQLTNQAGNRQIANIKHGLAHNVGGSGGTAAVTILAG